jgi:repressor LexA
MSQPRAAQAPAIRIAIEAAGVMIPNSDGDGATALIYAVDGRAKSFSAGLENARLYSKIPTFIPSPPPAGRGPGRQTPMSKRKTPSARVAKPRTDARPKRGRVAAAVAAVRGNPMGLELSDEGDQGDRPTDRQMEIYAFIRDKIHSRGFGPTVREIGQAFKIRSPNGVVCHLKALERKGLISRGKNMSRAIELVNEPAHLRGLPMAGWVAAGTLRTADEQRERIDFESLFNRDNHFVLKVMGDSMVDAQIADGDWVVIQKKQTAHAGDIVVAQTEDGEATLKHWFPERDRIRLQPANASMKPIYVRNAKVLGVLVGVVRKT